MCFIEYVHHLLLLVSAHVMLSVGDSAVQLVCLRASDREVARTLRPSHSNKQSGKNIGRRPLTLVMMTLFCRFLVFNCWLLFCVFGEALCSIWLALSFSFDHAYCVLDLRFVCVHTYLHKITKVTMSISNLY